MASAPDSGIFLDPWRISTDKDDNLVFHNSRTSKSFMITPSGIAAPTRHSVKVGRPQRRYRGPHTEAQDGMIVGMVHSRDKVNRESYVQIEYDGLPRVRVSANGDQHVWDNCFSIPVPTGKQYTLSEDLEESCESNFYWIPLTT
ncbi:hypothetical protein ACIPYS_08275 [Kitasatospora sp. NPDC089913]|uniref:hypothetical protein n=1 Tax=Kitasatospora sp. NPDC089913 TaxID=3364080 RepID=UPI00382312B9